MPIKQKPVPLLELCRRFFSSETFQDGASQAGPGVEPSRTAVVPRKETGFRLMTSHLRSLARGPASIRSGSKEAVGNNGLTRVENRLLDLYQLQNKYQSSTVQGCDLVSISQTLTKKLHEYL